MNHIFQPKRAAAVLNAILLVGGLCKVLLPTTGLAQDGTVLETFWLDAEEEMCDDWTHARIRYNLTVGKGFDPRLDYRGLNFLQMVGNTTKPLEFDVIQGEAQSPRYFDWWVIKYSWSFIWLPDSENRKYLEENCSHTADLSGDSTLYAPTGNAVGTVSEFSGSWSWKSANRVRQGDPEFVQVEEFDIELNLNECAECNCDSNGSSATIESVHYSISLGLSEDKRSLGELALHSDEILPFAQMRAKLKPQKLKGKISNFWSGGTKYDTYSTSEVVAHSSAESPYKQKIDLYRSKYHPATEKYVTDGNHPFKTVFLENPDASDAINNRFLITEYEGANFLRSFEYLHDPATSTWTLSKRGGSDAQLHSVESVSESTDAETGDKITTRTILDGALAIVSCVSEFRRQFPWGEELVKKIADPNGVALVTTHSFYDDSATAPSGSYGKPKLNVFPDGSWERFEYDHIGRPTKKVTPFLNAPPDAPELECIVDTTSYSSSNPRSTDIRTTLGQETARRYTATTLNITAHPGQRSKQLSITCVTPGAAWDDPRNLVTSTSYPDDMLNPLSKYSTTVTPDGVVIESSKPWDKTIETTKPASGERLGTETTTTNTTTKDTVEVRDIASNLLISRTITQKDSKFRPTRIDHLDGTYETFTYDCCNLESKRDRQGVVTEYDYNPFGELIAETRDGITLVYTLNPLGRTIRTTRIGSDGSSMLISSVEYDVAGRMVSTKNALNQETTYSQVALPSGGTQSTTANPDGTTRIETYARDGSLLSVSGTAARPTEIEYGIENNQLYRKEIALGEGDQEWQKTFTDFAGRTYKTLYSDDSFDLKLYNAKGQLASSLDPDGLRTLYQYNPLGQLEISALDLNANGVIDFAGPDRIMRNHQEFGTRDGIPVARTITTSWATESSAEPYTVQTTERSLTSLKSWITQGNLTQTQETLQDATGSTERITLADGSIRESRTENGRSIRSIVRDNAGTLLREINYSYDEHGRLKHQTDARQGTTTYQYDLADRIISVTQPPPNSTTPAPVTSMTYTANGQIETTTLPDSSVVYSEFWPTGDLKKQHGSQTYPVEYTYDSQGRMKTMTTATGTTTWNYDPQRGWLTSKQDANGKGASYTYTRAGKLKTRTWARGIVTTYAYNTAGELTGIDYSDDTPDLWFELDRLGRPISRNDASGTHQFSYHPDGRIIEQTVSSGSLDGLKLIPEYDELNRRTTLRALWNAREISRHDTEYDGASRIAAVSNGQLRTSYSYLPQSSLISEVTTRQGNKPLLNVRKTWDNLGRLTEIRNQATRANTKSGYQYNNLNQRTERTLEDNTRWEFGYDSLGQVTSGSKLLPDGRPLRGYDFDYTFDEIGNRLSTNTNGHEANYTPNSLNQYTERTVPGSVDIVGSARAEATVTVNQQSTHRQGEYFHRQLPVENSGAAAVEQVEVNAVLKQAGAGGTDLLQTKTGELLIPGTPEAFEYDLDGNLTRNGLWELTWDGENRLVQMISRPDVPDAARKKLVFRYDGMSRRIGKQVFAWDTTTNGYAVVPSSDLRFLYDGWNLLAELDSQGNVVRSYFWGLDLSGSLQGAGGVGGLLALTKGSETYCYTYDGNGNVTGLVDKEGQNVAKYQYGPFGELLESTGGLEGENPFKFSTKYADGESGWYYYGYRYLDTSTGRWLSRDPIGEKGGKNLYRFCNNQPLTVVDVDGRSPYESGESRGWAAPPPPPPTPNPESLFFDFLQGTNVTTHHFGGDHRLTQEIKRGFLGETIRTRAKSFAQAHCADRSRYQFAIPHRLALGGELQLIPDLAFPFWFAYQTSENPMTAFVGSFTGGSAWITNVDCSRCEATIYVYAENSSGAYSATRYPPAFGGYAGNPSLYEAVSWKLALEAIASLSQVDISVGFNSSALLPNNPYGPGKPLNTITQSFSWSETISFK